MEETNPSPETADPRGFEPIVDIPDESEEDDVEEDYAKSRIDLSYVVPEKKLPPTTPLPLGGGRSVFGQKIVLKHFLISLLDTVYELPRELVLLILHAFMVANDDFFVFNPFWSDNEKILKEYIEKNRIPFWEITKENIAKAGVSYTSLQMEVPLGSRPRKVRLECDQGDIWIGVAPSHHLSSRFSPYISGYGWWVNSKFTTVGNDAMISLSSPRFVSGQGMIITLLIDAVEKTTTWTFHTARSEITGLASDRVVVQQIALVDPTWCLSFCLHNQGDRIVIDTNIADY